MISSKDMVLLLQNLRCKPCLYRHDVCLGFANYIRDCFSGYVPSGHMLFDGKLFASKIVDYVPFDAVHNYKSKLYDSWTTKFLVDIHYDVKLETIASQNHARAEAFFLVSYIEVPLED